MGYFMVIHPLVIPWFAMIWHGKYTIWGIHREYVSLVWRNVREKIWNYTLKTWTYVYNNYIKDWGQSTQIPIFYSQCDIEKFLNMENWRIPSFSRDTQCKRLTKRCRDWWSVASHKMTTGETKNHWLVVWTMEFYDWKLALWNQESFVKYGKPWNHDFPISPWFSIYLKPRILKLWRLGIWPQGSVWMIWGDDLPMIMNYINFCQSEYTK